MVKASVIEKLNRVKMSGKMVALVNYFLGHDKSFVFEATPAIVELCGTSDGFIFARVENDCGANDMIGSKSDLFLNVTGLSVCAGLSQEETDWLLGQVPVCCREAS